MLKHALNHSDAYNIRNVLVIGYGAISRYILSKIEKNTNLYKVDLVSDFLLDNNKNTPTFINNIFSYTSFIDPKNYDFIIFANKRYQKSPNIILNNYPSENIIYLQNGWFSKLENVGILYNSMLIDNNDKLNITNEGIIYVSSKKWHLFFESIDVAVKLEENIENKKMQKLGLNLTVNTLSVLYEKTRKESVNQESKEFLNGLFNDIEKIYNKYQEEENIQIEWDRESFLTILENVDNSYSSSLMDFKRNKQTEIPLFFSFYLNYSKKHSIDIPFINELYEKIKFKIL
jgi:ketopantoate reductase